MGVDDTDDSNGLFGASSEAALPKPQNITGSSSKGSSSKAMAVETNVA